MSNSENLCLKLPVYRWSWATNFRDDEEPELSSDSDESPTRPHMCYQCPSCIQTSVVAGYTEHLDERTPLFRGTRMQPFPSEPSVPFYRSSRCIDLTLIYAFVAILLFSTGIGIYLIALHSKGANIEEFDFVSNENWGVNTAYLKDLPPLQAPVSRILLLNISSNCNITNQNCLVYRKYSDRGKEKNRLYAGEVLYNFYEDKDGKIFEGRGYKYQSVCGRNDGCGDIFAIALLDASKGPSAIQTRKLKAFLDYCVMDDTLSSCYEILVTDSSNRAFIDLAFNLDEMNRKDGTCLLYLS